MLWLEGGGWNLLQEAVLDVRTWTSAPPHPSCCISDELETPDSGLAVPRQGPALFVGLFLVQGAVGQEVSY